VKAMEGLLRRSLARDARTPGVCPDPGILAAYYERSLGADEIAGHELHFSRCARCREQLAAMARTDAPVGAGSHFPNEGTRTVWLWDWRWLAPVAAVMAFAIVVFLRVHAAKEAAQHMWTAPFVALSKPDQPPPAPPQGQDQVAILTPGQSESRMTGQVTATAKGQKKEPFSRLVAPPPESSPAGAARIAPSAAGAKLQNSPSPELDAIEKGGESSTRTAIKQRPAEASDAGSAAGVGAGVVGGVSSESQLTTDARDKKDKVVIPSSTTEAVEVTSAAPGVPASTAPARPPSFSDSQARVANGGVGGTASSGANAQVEAGNAAPPVRVYKNLAAPPKSGQGGGSAGAGGILKKDDGEAAATMILTPDPAILWRFAGSGFVERSEDGGATWQGEQPSPDGHLLAGSAPSATVCWLVGRDGLILLTKDSITWKRITPPVVTDFVGVSAVNAPNATITAADGRKFTTRDAGKKWKPAQ
jgi:hypothetical protein